MHSVSRAVVREALARLKSEGLVKSQQGSGVFVDPNFQKNAFRIAAPTPGDNQDLEHILELMLSIEVTAARYAAQRRTEPDLKKMRQAGRVVAEMHAEIRKAIKPGVTTAALDQIGRDVIAKRGARSNFLGYGNPPFSGVICASPNDVIVHGVPSPKVVLQEGDIISIDCGAIVDGWHGDAAFTAPVGTASPEALALIEATDRSLEAAIAAMQVGGRLSDIGAAVQAVAEGAGYSVVKEYTGHGIGTAMHESPDVPNWGKPGKGRRRDQNQGETGGEAGH